MTGAEGSPAAQIRAAAFAAHFCKVDGGQRIR